MQGRVMCKGGRVRWEREREKEEIQSNEGAF